MSSNLCSHQEASLWLAKGNGEAALRIAGPMLELNPQDLIAWQNTAWAMLQLGESVMAIENLKSIALALAEDKRPILAIALLKQLEALGEPIDEPVFRIASLYCSGSGRLSEIAPPVPPLPTSATIRPWPALQSRAAIVKRAKEVLANAGGQAALVQKSNDELPFVPLLSTLAIEDFVPLVRLLRREVFSTGAAIIEQGQLGRSIYIIAEGCVEVVRRDGQGNETLLTRLGPGAFFGEMALVSSAPRAALVRALETAVLLVADKTDLEALAQSVPEIGNVLVAFCHARMLQNLLRISPVLAPVPAARRPDLLACFSTDFRTRGNVIIKEGQTGPGLFLIVSGRVQVTKKEVRESIVLATLGPGDVFGEISLILRKPSTATVVALDDSALLFLPADGFRDVVRAYPELLQGAFDIALERETNNNSILACQATPADEMILL